MLIRLNDKKATIWIYNIYLTSTKISAIYNYWKLLARKSVLNKIMSRLTLVKVEWNSPQSKSKKPRITHQIFSPYYRGVHTFDNFFLKIIKNLICQQSKPWDILNLEGIVVTVDIDTVFRLWSAWSMFT